MHAHAQTLGSVTAQQGHQKQGSLQYMQQIGGYLLQESRMLFVYGMLVSEEGNFLPCMHAHHPAHLKLNQCRILNAD